LCRIQLFVPADNHINPGTMHSLRFVEKHSPR
jgi:hypothetical protein